MRSLSFLLFLPVPLIFLFSCTVTKRTHLPGYYVEWKRPLQKAETSAGTMVTIREPEMKTSAAAPVPASEALLVDSTIRLTEDTGVRQLPESVSPPQIAAYEETITGKDRVPLLRKQVIQQKKEAAVHRSQGGFERFLLVLLVAIVLVPILLLVMVFSVVTFNIQSVLLGLLLLLLLIVLIVVLIF